MFWVVVAVLYFILAAVAPAILGLFVAAGYGPGVCSDPSADAAAALASELDWSVGTREEAHS